jgi:hypothetical protein
MLPQQRRHPFAVGNIHFNEFGCVRHQFATTRDEIINNDDAPTGREQR